MLAHEAHGASERAEIQLAEVFGVLTTLLWFKHAANIARLLRGEESRIGKK